jgi:hypothetical protein
MLLKKNAKKYRNNVDLLVPIIILRFRKAIGTVVVWQLFLIL